MTQSATKGRIVFAVVDERVNNGDDEAVAVITKVLDSEEGEQRVNLRVLLDTGQDKRLTNVLLLDSRPDEDTELPDDVKVTKRVAFWPPQS